MTVLNSIAGLLCGVLSGYGIGGGSLLLIYMTQAAKLAQPVAQGINLVYFLPTSGAALVSHARNGLIDLKTVLWAALPGMLTASLAALAATSLDPTLLRRLFGIFLIFTGGKMLIGNK